MKTFLKGYDMKWVPYLIIVLWAISAVTLILMLSGCGSTVQPQVGSGTVEDKTLSGNTVDFLTLFRVQNVYGTVYNISDSNNGKTER